MTSWKEDTWRSLAASKFGPICHGACVPRFMAARHFFRIAINSRNTRGKEEGSKSYQTSWRERLSLLLMSLIHFLTKLWVGVATFLSSLPGHILRDIPNLIKHWKSSCHRLLKLYKCRPVTASSSHLRTMLPESNSWPLPAKTAQLRNLVLIWLKIPVLWQ